MVKGKCAQCGEIKELTEVKGLPFSFKFMACDECRSHISVGPGGNFKVTYSTFPANNSAVNKSTTKTTNSNKIKIW